MKTAISVLQEMMVKLGGIPEYECVSQSGPNHLATFEYRCKACGLAVTAAGRSKKEAKQNVAKLMLHKLSLNGHRVPPPYGQPHSASTQRTAGGTLEDCELDGEDAIPMRSFVALLKELCDSYSLPAVLYELVGDTGPPHQRHFTIRARMGLHERCATATTKKAARQIAAEQLYSYLRENMPRITADFNEKEALLRAHEKAMERYVELQKDCPNRVDLSQKISDYHLGLFGQMDDEKRKEVKQSLFESEEKMTLENVETMLKELTEPLGLTIKYSEMECDNGGALSVLELSPTSPPLAFAGADRAVAATAALRYMRLSICFNK